jgi:hypothetical protein
LQGHQGVKKVEGAARMEFEALTQFIGVQRAVRQLCEKPQFRRRQDSPSGKEAQTQLQDPFR